MSFWIRRKVFVTGGSGFIGRHLVRQLDRFGAIVLAPPHGTVDLERPDSADVIADWKPSVIIHLAARFGGLHWAAQSDVDASAVNNAINRTIMDAVEKHRPEGGVLVAGSACTYPPCDAPLVEAQYLTGDPHPSVRSFAGTKRALAAWALDHDASQPIFPTVYGPGDHIDDPVRSHFLGGLLGRLLTATREKTSEFVVWGTGKPVRDVLYVDDAVSAILFLLEEKATGLFNVGSGVGHSVAAFAEYAAHVVDYRGTLVFDPEKPDGQMFKVIDPRKIQQLGWKLRVRLDEGLRRTVEWMQEARP